MVIVGHRRTFEAIDNAGFGILYVTDYVDPGSLLLGILYLYGIVAYDIVGCDSRVVDTVDAAQRTEVALYGAGCEL